MSISIHALLAESDKSIPVVFLGNNPFLSTLSLRRATTPRLSRVVPTPIFLSTLSLRRATLVFAARQPAIRVFLSTLSLRRATGLGRQRRDLLRFLSTLSLRRATTRHELPPGDASISIHALLAESDKAKSKAWLKCINFYPRSPCGERL